MPPKLAFRRSSLVRYGAALVAVAAGIGGHLGLEAWVGQKMSPFVTFYPLVMLVALLAGLGPGLLATVVASLAVDYWLLDPPGWGIANPVVALHLALFTAINLFLCGVAEVLRRARLKAAAFDREQALRETRRQNEFLADSIPNLAWRANSDGYITWYNQRWYEYTGTTPQQMEGWGWQSVHDPQTLPAVLERWKASIATGQPFEMTFPLRGADGVFRPFLTRVAPLKDAQGRVQQWFGTNTDISVKQRAQEALRESEERLAAFAAATFEGIVLSDRGRIVDCNEQFAQMTGWSVPELKGRSIEEFIAPEDRPRVLENVHAGRESTLEHQVLRRDGSRITVEVHGRPRDPSRLGLRHSAIRDITERKQHEQVLERLNRTLEALKDSSQAMLRATSEAQYLDEVCQIVVQDCGHAMVWIGFAAHDEAQSVRPVAYAGFEKGYLETLRITWADTERGQGPTGTAIRTGQPCVCRNVLTDPRLAPWRAEALKRGYASSLAVPLLDEGRAFGALTIYAGQPDRFSEDEEALLIQLADDVSYCLGALRLRADREWAERRSELLAATASRLLATYAPQGVVEDLCRQALPFLDCQAFLNYLVVAAAGDGRTPARLHLNACDGIPAEAARQIEWLDFGSTVSGCAARDACCIVTEDVQTTADPRTELVRAHGIQAYACYPLLVEGRVLGTLSFGTRTRGRFGPEELSLMKAVADLVAMALERQRSRAALHQAKQELEQRVAERTAELRAKSLYARSLLEASLDPLVTINPAGKITDVNRATEEATGVSRQSLVGASFSDYFTEPAQAEAGYQQVLAEGLVRDYPLTIRHASGRTTEVLYHATVYRDEAGQVQGVFAAARDITERQQAERRRGFTIALLALFAQKTSAPDYLQSVLEILRQWSGGQALGLRLTDEHGAIPYASWAGFEPEFVRLENRLSLPPDNCFCLRALAQDVEPQDRALLTPGGSYRCDDAITFANGLPPAQRARYGGNCIKFGFASLAIVPIRYREKVVGVIHLADRRPGRFSLGMVEFLEGMAPLIGEAVQRFQTEAELARHRDQLELLVQQRTQELTNANARLQETAADLTRSNRDLEQFAYVASHDLQEPLRAVGGYVKLLQLRFPDKLDAKAREYVAGAFEGATRMERLIIDLLAYSRVGTRGDAFVPADLNTVLGQALSNLKAVLESAHATLTHDPLPTLTVDATQMTQLFQNLLGNALKFHGESPPRIHVSARRQEGRWVFAVRDNGIGLEPQYYEKIFQIFQRLHTRKDYAGTGIGLAICKKIVERHGGSIWVESQPGQGSTFYFSLPEAAGA